MSLYQALLLALLQGFTEFLPISSSGHLALLGQWWQQQGMIDQGLAFDAAIHLGTLAAIVWYARADVGQLLNVLRQRFSAAGRHLFTLLLLATLPVLVCGFLLQHWIELATRNLTVIAITTLLFGLLLGLADSFGRRRLEIVQLRWPMALWIGLAQVLALIPGTSRSGVTMSAGLALGLTRRQAAKFSFLLAIPVLAAAGGYNLLRIAQASGGGQLAYSMPTLILATAASGLVAFATIRLFMALVERIGMWPFAIYRILLGLILLWLLW